MSKTFVLYHANCNDGNAAAIAAHLKFGEAATYIPVQYNKPMPEIPDQSDVFILDFSYPREILERLHDRSKSILVLDHHKTAMEELKGLPYAKFDMTKSGAVLAWEHFHPGEIMPTLFHIVQDRDLWKFKSPRTRAVTAALQTLVPDFRDYPKYFWNDDMLFSKGTAKLEFDTLDIDSAVRKAVVTEWGQSGYKAAILNTIHLFSEIGERIYLNYDVDFVAMYFITDSGELVFSFRSKAPVDVSVLAKRLGGGGHPQACGASMDLLSGATFLHDLYQDAKPLKEFKIKKE